MGGRWRSGEHGTRTVTRDEEGGSVSARCREPEGEDAVEVERDLGRDLDGVVDTADAVADAGAETDVDDEFPATPTDDAREEPEEERRSEDREKVVEAEEVGTGEGEALPGARATTTREPVTRTTVATGALLGFS